MNLSRHFRSVRERRSPSLVNGEDDDDGLNLSQNDVSFDDFSEVLVDADDLPNNCESAPVEPSKHPDAHPLLPHSSSDLWLDLPEIDRLLSCYSVIRSFGFILRLSPFTFKELCRDISYQSSTTLIDELHISILRTLQLYPPVLDEGDGSLFQSEEISYPVKEGILLYTQDAAFRFLDSLTWPEFLRKWMNARGNAGDTEASDFQNGCEYFQLNTNSKINMLNVICEDLLDSWIIRKEVQHREQMLDYLLSSEKQEVAEKNRMMKSADNASADNAPALPEAYDHLYIREGLDSLELDVCDVTGVGGTLICCDGCPASYLARSVGMKRVGDDSQKWFCEECRIGGQIRSHRFLHRACSALRWSAQPPFSIIGQNSDGLRCFSAYGRVFVGKGKDLYAYYSTVDKVEALISFFKTTRLSAGADTSPSSEKNTDESGNTDSHGASRADFSPGLRKRPRTSEVASDEDSESDDDESTWDAELVLKRKKKAIIEQMEFRLVVESKQSCANEYVNKYRDAMSLADVTVLYNKGREKEKKRGDASISRKWGNWPKSQDSQFDSNSALGSVASYLLQTEKSLYGLVDGPFLKPCGRQEWIEWVRQADEVSELSKAALILESAVRPSALLRVWFDGTDKKLPGRSRGGGRKSKDIKKDNREDVDWSELRDAGILEDVSMQAQASVDEDDNKQYFVWISGRQVMPLSVNLSRKSLRQLVLTAGEAEVRGMMYRGPCAVPSARLIWIREILDAKTTAQLALQLRVFDEALRADIFRKPVPPCDVSIQSNVVERVVGRREVGSGYLQYEVKMFGDDTKTEWMSQENTPIYCIREFEAEFRKTAEIESKKLWWKDFDFHPGVSVEVEFENQWYQGYVVECFDDKESFSEEQDFGDVEWEDGVGVVRVHYIGGLDEEDEYIRKDDERLREDKKAESRMLKDRTRRMHEDRKLRRIADKEQRMHARLALYQERIRLREVEHLARGRDVEKVKEKEKKEQEKLEKFRQREREKQGKIRDRESDRESRIRERREEQDKKKEEQKMIKKAARERQRIEQGKKGWWKDFNWCIGVMVEMEWDDEWWDAIVIQVLPAKAQHANNAEEDSVLQGEPAAPISHAREAGLDVPCPALSDGVEVGNKRTACKESIESQDGASQKAEEAEGWEAALGYMVKKCQGPRIYYPKDWPEEGVYICNEDDRPVDIARKHRVNLERLVRNNKKAYPSLSKTSALKAGTALKLPLPLDIRIGTSPPPPADPLGVGIVLIHYVGGDENETEWVFRSSRRMRPSADKLWNAVAVEAAEEMMSVLAPDPGAWKKHCARVLKRVRKNDKSWPFWEPVDPAKEGLDDYYDVIAKPMCLDTVEAALNADQYRNADEFAGDMRLIFENAMQYNPPDHGYHQMAQKMLDIFNDLWASGHHGNNWGQPFGAAPSDFVSHLKESNTLAVTPASNRKKIKRQSIEKEQVKGGEKGKLGTVETAAETGDSQMQEAAGEDKGNAIEMKAGGYKSTSFMDRRLTSNSRMHLKGLLETLMQNDLAKAFLEPVAVCEAPDYYEIIKKPMDLGTLHNILLTRKGYTPAAFERNLRLIFDNAREYNGEDDQISKSANALERMFERKWTKLLPVLESERQSVENSRVSKSADAVEEGLPIAATLEKKKDGAKGKEPGALKRVRQEDMDDRASSPAIACRPIKRHKTTPKERESDIPTPEDHLGDQVLNISDLQLPGALESQGKKKKSGGQAARRTDEEALQPAESKHGSKAKKQETCESSDVGLEHVVLSDCLSMLDRLLSARGGHFFAEPVDAEALGLSDYHEIVTEPLDFSTIRERLLSGFYCAQRKGKAGSQVFGEKDGERMREAFGRDVRKVLDNAMLYNPESDRVYKAAASILNFFQTNWPSAGGAAAKASKAPSETTTSTARRAAAEPASGRQAARVRQASQSVSDEAADSDAECTEEAEPARAGGAEADGAPGRRSRPRDASRGAAAGRGGEGLAAAAAAEGVEGCDEDAGGGVDEGVGGGGDAGDGESEDDERPRRRPRKAGR